MQLFNKWEQVWNNKDARAFLDMHHAEFDPSSTKSRSILGNG